MSIDSLIESEVTKKTYNFYIDTVETQEKVKRLDWNYSLNSDDLEGLSKTYKECVGWEFNHYVTDEDIIEKRYSKKRIVLIQAKERGKASFDRAGLIYY